jgi:hypothetical protein
MTKCLEWCQKLHESINRDTKRGAPVQIARSRVFGMHACAALEPVVVVVAVAVVRARQWVLRRRKAERNPPRPAGVLCRDHVHHRHPGGGGGGSSSLLQLVMLSTQLSRRSLRYRCPRAQLSLQLHTHRQSPWV